MSKNVKCVVVGDGTVGKTSLLLSYTQNRFPVEYVPTIFENFTTGVEVDGTPFHLSLWDTAGQEEYARLRYLSYPETDVFLLCYSVNEMSTFHNIGEHWHGELKHHCPEAKIVLVGTKVDLRVEAEKNSQAFVTKEMGMDLAKNLQVDRYVECSALTQDGLVELFETAMRCATNMNENNKRKKRKTCPLL